MFFHIKKYETFLKIFVQEVLEFLIRGQISIGIKSSFSNYHREKTQTDILLTARNRIIDHLQ